MCTKVTILNYFRSRWNGDIWLFFSYQVMFLYRYFLSSVHMQNMYMKHSCMFFSLNDRHALLIKVCCKNKIMIIILSCNLSIHHFAVLHMYILCSCYRKECQLCSGHELYLLFCKIPLLPLLHCMFLTFLLRLITRIGSKCYGLINLIHVLSFFQIFHLSIVHCIVISV